MRNIDFPHIPSEWCGKHPTYLAKNYTLINV